MKRFNVNLPDEMYEKLRERAFNKRISMSQIVQENLKFLNIVEETIIKGKVPTPTMGNTVVLRTTSDVCIHGKEKTLCTVSKCPNYASWK